MCTQAKVFGGCKEALDYIEKNSRDLGLKNVHRLQVSGAFHTPLMEPAIKSFNKALSSIPIEEPNTKVYSNYCADPYTANEKINKKYLLRQMVCPVKWEQILHKLYERPVGTPFPRTFDMASNGTMKTILKMVNEKAIKSCYIY